MQACHALAAAGLVREASGNVSVRDGDRIAVTATGARFAQLEPDDVVVVDLDGTVLEGRGAPSSELPLHLGIYHRYEAGAIVHTHPPVATALACVLHELPCVHYEMLAFGGPIRVAPYAPSGTPELAGLVVEALEGRTAVLMSNHGAVTHGADLDAAVQATELLEWAATVYWRASAIGSPRQLDAGMSTRTPS